MMMMMNLYEIKTLYSSVCSVDFSDYQYNTTATDETSSDVISAPLGPDAINAIWLLSLALVFKMIITIFTFGLKVRREILFKEQLP